MKLRSNSDWRAWGLLDPLYGVATIPGKSKTDTAAWKDEEFYALGAADWDVFRPHWERYGLQTNTCLEIGCGAGRITRQLGRCFKVVHALDVSEAMIDYARQHVDNTVVHFHVADGATLPFPTGSIDAVFSTHVFQHLEYPSDGAAYFHEIYRVLARGGTMMIHLPVIVWPIGSFKPVYRRMHGVKASLADLTAMAGRWAFSVGLRKEPWARGTLYEVDWLHETLRAIGFREVEINIYFLPTSSVTHPFVFARKT